jgi:hypothetical protein
MRRAMRAHEDGRHRGVNRKHTEQHGGKRLVTRIRGGGLKLEGNHLKGDVPMQDLRGVEVLAYLEAWRACESGEGLKESLRGLMRLEEGLKARAKRVTSGRR